MHIMDWFAGLEFPYQHVVEQAEELGTIGDFQNTQVGAVNSSYTEDVWDPLAGILE